MHCWPRYLLWLLIVLLGAGQMLAACGQKGPLYMPDKPAAESATSDEVPVAPEFDPEDLEPEAAQDIDSAL
jgi:predicted small lipoprotein YifL